MDVAEDFTQPKSKRININIIIVPSPKYAAKDILKKKKWRDNLAKLLRLSLYPMRFLSGLFMKLWRAIRMKKKCMKRQ